MSSFDGHRATSPHLTTDPLQHQTETQSQPQTQSSPSIPPTTQNLSPSYFTYPVKYAVTSALRRLQSDPPFASLRKSSRSRGSSPAPSEKSTPANASSLHITGQSSVFSPSGRARTPPMQPPPLTPLHLTGYNAGTQSATKVLSTLLAEEIRLLVPARMQLEEEWRLIFSLDQDGSSLSTLFDKCENFRGRRGGFVLVVKDASGGIFGAYLTDAPRPSNGHYYGTGECFLWRATTLPTIPTLASLPPLPSEDTTNAQRMTTIGSPTSSRRSSKRPSQQQSTPLSPSLAANGKRGSKHEESLIDMDEPMEKPAVDVVPPTPVDTRISRELPSSTNGGIDTPSTMGGRSGTATPERIRFKAFPYSGINDYMIFCEHGFLSVGGGDGHYGLWLDGSLEKGRSAPCPTFGNESLSDEGSKFEIIDVEIWYLGV